MKDLFSNVKCMNAISPQRSANNTALTGNWIDRLGFQSVFFAIQSGTLGDSDATMTALVEESDSDAGSHSDAAAVADADLMGTEAGASFAAADDDDVKKIGYKGTKRYVRLTLTPANNTGNNDVSALAILGHPHMAPQSTQAT